MSYAQNGEDVRLWCALSDVKDGFYVDVGAGDPARDSVTRSFYDQGWSGINIEPSRDEYEALCRDRPRDINLCVAAGIKNGTGMFHSYPGRGIYAIDELVRRPLEDAGVVGEAVELPVMALHTILAVHRPDEGEIHFLKIDVEGNEAAVLAGTCFNCDRPWIVVCEATRPHTQIRTDHLWEHLLLERDYEFSIFDGLNSWYVRHESRDLHRLLQT